MGNWQAIVSIGSIAVRSISQARGKIFSGVASTCRSAQCRPPVACVGRESTYLRMERGNGRPTLSSCVRHRTDGTCSLDYSPINYVVLPAKDGCRRLRSSCCANVEREPRGTNQALCYGLCRFLRGGGGLRGLRPAGIAGACTHPWPSSGFTRKRSGPSCGRARPPVVSRQATQSRRNCQLRNLP
jgi:hypothetical protein